MSYTYVGSTGNIIAPSAKINVIVAHIILSTIIRPPANDIIVNQKVLICIN